MEKLGQIHRDAQRDGTYDLIVVDTPPSRSALDFLDAPERLGASSTAGSSGCCWPPRVVRPS